MEYADSDELLDRTFRAVECRMLMIWEYADIESSKVCLATLLSLHNIKYLTHLVLSA